MADMRSRTTTNRWERENGGRETGDGKTEMDQKIGKFEDLEVWKEGMSLAAKIYKNLNNCRDYGLRDQMQRSAVSIPSNIAEGFERNTNKDYIHFLYISKGSCKISAMLYKLIKIRKEKF